MSNIRRDSPLHLIQRLARGLFILWAGEIPFRYSDINQLPPIVIYACWAVQAALIGAAFAGAYALGRSGIVGGAVVLLVPFLYLSVVHVLLLTEARQSLPAMPV